MLITLFTTLSIRALLKLGPCPNCNNLAVMRFESAFFRYKLYPIDINYNSIITS